ncbi:MAG: S16 family serine protease [Acidobacteriota bacterium]
MKPTSRQRALGPWCWPREGSARRALGDSHGDQPPARPGDAVGLATVGQRGESVVVLFRAGEPTETGSLALGRRAVEAWRWAGAALPRVVPFRWRGLHEGELDVPAVHRLAHHVEQGAATRISAVDGRSFGFSFLLSLASLLFEQPPEDDVACAGQLQADGTLAPCDGLALKVAALAGAPGLRRVLVAAPRSENDETELKTAAFQAPSGVELVPVCAARELIELGLGLELNERLRKEAATPDGRRELVSLLQAQALGESSVVVGWGSLEDTARVVRETCADSTEEREWAWRLGFVESVAARHGGRHAPLPDLAVLSRWMEEAPALRWRLLAQVVQHAADNGEPSRSEVQELIERLDLPEVGRSNAEQLTVHGSLVRLESIGPEPSSALTRARQVLDTRLAFSLAPGSSRVLCSAFRLAGALTEGSVFAQLEQVARRLADQGAFLAADHGFLRLSRLVGASWLEPVSPATLAGLRAVAADATLPSHLRWSAWRTVVRCSPTSKETLEQPGPPETVEGRIFRALAELDAALRGGDEGREALTRLAEVQPGILRQLSSDEGPDGERVSRHFPY